MRPLTASKQLEESYHLATPTYTLMLSYLLTGNSKNNVHARTHAHTQI